MIFAVFAILCFVMQSLCCKEFSRRFPETVSILAAMIASSMLVVILIIIVYGGTGLLAPDEWGIAIAFGFWFVITLASITLALKNGHMGITLLIQNSSLIVPALYGVLFRHESITMRMAIGIACILVMLALSTLGGATPADAPTRRRWNRKLWALFTMLAFIGDSALAILQGSMALSKTDPATFTLWTSLFSLGFAAALYLASARSAQASLAPLRANTGAFCLCCIGIGAGTAGGNILSIMALGRLPGVVLFPMRQGSVVLLMWAAGTIFYRERVNRTGWLLLGFGLTGVVLLNL